jgi:hypothetical protein
VLFLVFHNFIIEIHTGMVFNVSRVIATFFQHIAGRWAHQNDISHFDDFCNGIAPFKVLFQRGGGSSRQQPGDMVLTITPLNGGRWQAIFVRTHKGNVGD